MNISLAKQFVTLLSRLWCRLSPLNFPGSSTTCIDHSDQFFCSLWMFHRQHHHNLFFFSTFFFIASLLYGPFPHGRPVAIRVYCRLLTVGTLRTRSICVLAVHTTSPLSRDWFCSLEEVTNDDDAEAIDRCWRIGIHVCSRHDVPRVLGLRRLDVVYVHGCE
jgi:hypothetical protein